MIKEAAARFYPKSHHIGVVMGAAPWDTIYSSKQVYVLWSDGSSGAYPLSVIVMGWRRVEEC